jgi:hypothetical protein
MQITELPNTVQEALGDEAAKDFVAWLEKHLNAANLTEIQISSFVARQKVNVLMLERVSNLLLADKPKLLQMADNSWIWRVPIDLTLPAKGRIGRVGELEVDAHYGEVRYNEELLTQIVTEVQRLMQENNSPSLYAPDF